MELLAEYGLFLAKAVTIVAAILIVAGGIAGLSARRRPHAKDRIEVRHLNQHYEDMAQALKTAILPKKDARHARKGRRKGGRWWWRRRRVEAAPKPRVFVLNFHGNVLASALSSLREEITAVLTVAGPEDEVFLRLESGGGLVHAYGLAASQLLRLKAKGIPLTVSVDKVAASGGYMMACVADRLIAAPFAVIGSIGVVAQLPNFHRLLKRNEIDYEQITAGEYKRTLTLFGENTERARDKVRQEVEEAHVLFKDFIQEHRPALDVPQVATGEYWYGLKALELKLVDTLQTSDDYLMQASQRAELYQVSYTPHKPLKERLFGRVREGLERAGLSRLLHGEGESFL